MNSHLNIHGTAEHPHLLGNGSSLSFGGRSTHARPSRVHREVFFDLPDGPLRHWNTKEASKRWRSANLHVLLDPPLPDRETSNERSREKERVGLFACPCPMEESSSPIPMCQVQLVAVGHGSCSCAQRKKGLKKTRYEGHDKSVAHRRLL